MAEYFGSMSFGLAMPYGDAHKDVVGSDVRGIPTLKCAGARQWRSRARARARSRPARPSCRLFRRDGTLVTAKAREFVAGDAAGAKFPWA